MNILFFLTPKAMCAYIEAGDTLRQAMELLSGLAGGSRMIGIISHVGELKNRIDKKIIISKNLTGSSVTIEA